ncbi:fungal-specific transcription factor domain-containing protein [Amylocarpus encephaloides]|uniref:Fungal-specific transcription factor domain-containing protein n=1 Tax=Amylocarpus encephaloides TaxID=45428 RepID=A0A9P8C248_9HELO|nr:fungal-specific transcription factor domain-containing protein [Amylocarpus encephaloides]
MNTVEPESPAYATISPDTTFSENPFAGSPSAIRIGDGTLEPLKRKQKRNKPTLSCEECVERKTKCDRGRPNCLACIKRQAECKYAYVANILEETGRISGTARRVTKPPKRNLSLSNGFDGPKHAPVPDERSASRGSTSSSIGLLSHVPYSHPTASNVFGIGSEHPFANYWTCQGGLPETISVLPDKIQADILLERYFECVDPVYPMIHRQTFYADYEHLWGLPQPEKDRTDGALIAMLFAMLAIGTQFVTTSPPKERQQTAEFYVSAAHQSLRMSSYLSKASVRSIQAMVLITYFLINDNHASDGWAFAGILIRQAYAMGLHRDPNIVCPTASPFDKQLRRKLWQAVLLQDTFLTVLLSLPPSATHTDVSVADLIDDESSIASSDPTDTAYMRGSWTLANLVQETICSPRSLDLPICSTPRQKTKLLVDFKSVYRSFPDIFRSWTPASLTNLAIAAPRVVRQTLFLTSNYFHNVMLLHSSFSPEVPINSRGALEAAHDAIAAFFLLYLFFESEAKVWWVFNHRAFLECLCIGGILRDELKEEGGEETVLRDQLFIRGKEDLVRMIEIMQQMSEGEHGSAVAATRVEVLRAYI